jgi:predicted ATPase
VLRDVAELDEPALQASLDRLADADLLFVEGAPPQASYRFKHALIQDAAYDRLLKSRRQALHRRAAEILRDDPERAAAEPEVIAHHFTQGGLEDLAIEWWGKAGDQALRRSAFQEAIAHLGKAIAMADKAGDASAPRAAASTTAEGQRLKLQTSLGQAMMYSRGHGTEETKTAFARARALAAGVESASERFDAYYGLFVGSISGGELSSAQETAESFLRDAENEGRMTEAAVARRCVGIARLFQGDFIGAEANLAEALRTYDPERDRDAKFRFGADTGAVAAAYLTLAIWALGDVERAQTLSEEASARADETGHAPTRANAYHIISLYYMLRGDPEIARRTATIVVDLGREHGMALFLASGEVDSNWARVRLGDRESAMAGVGEALAAYLGQGSRLFAPLFQGLLAELEAEGQDANDALQRIDEALALANDTGMHWTDAMLHRIRGDILLKRNPADPAPAEDAYQTAIAIAREQGARSYELLASLALAKLCKSTSRPVEAHAVLAPALDGFSPTPEMPEIGEAQALLAALAETEEVKAAERQRQRRLDLQTAYGQALTWGKGFASEEASAAFARVDEFAGSNANASARFEVYLAESMSSLTRGQLRLAGETCETFLREAEAEGRATKAASARSRLGLVLLNQGELKAARSVLERALADYDPRRDGETGSRFFDVEVNATAVLAATEWHLGEADRARELINRAVRRAEELGVLPIIVFALNWRAVLESQRHDVLATRDAADAVLALAEEHGIKSIADFNWIYVHWARGRLLDPEEGAVGFRQELAAFMDKGLRLGAPFFHGLLAELEATTRGPDSALTLVDHGLSIAEETEQHLSDPYLHGLRGKILLRRDPANPGPAEEAFQTAIATARQQSARSWGLRAALSLAKLYQSTGRPIEAHAVLAAALEGFTPTPEMPEIAEAQALVAALAETEEVKAAEAQRQRRLHLQTAYGQAMMWAKGYSAEETRAAFSRATALTAKTDNFAERFAAAQGQWTSALVRGELQSARQLASAFLKEAEAAGRAVEAGVARRGLAFACYQAADFLEARIHCERALEDCDPERDREALERFPDATGPIVVSVLAVTMWQLGEIDRARELIDQANRRASELAHAPSMAQPLRFKAILEILRGDAAAALSAAEALDALGADHGSPFWRTAAGLSAGWARGRLHDAAAGAEDLRRTLADRVDQDAKYDVWFYNGLLAELEAETLGTERALARIDEAIVLARQVETRCNLPFLHLLRGKLILKRDPSNPAAAEEAARHRTGARRAKLGSARGSVARQALSIDRSPRGRPRHCRARARRPCADAGDAGDRRGGGSAGVVGRDGCGEGCHRFAATKASPADKLRQGGHVVARLCCGGDEGRFCARSGTSRRGRQRPRPLRRLLLAMGRLHVARRTGLGAGHCRKLHTRR